MKRVTAKANQTIYDVAIEQYGTCEAVGKLMQDNPDMENDLQAVMEAGIEESDRRFYFDLPLPEGSTLLVDTDSRLIEKNILREIDKDVTTYDLKDYGTND